MEPTEEAAKTLTELNDKFREIKHDINNSMAVIMALSELGERNPKNFEKLGKTVLTRCPDIVHSLQAFGNELNSLAKELEPVTTE